MLIATLKKFLYILKISIQYKSTYVLPWPCKIVQSDEVFHEKTKSITINVIIKWKKAVWWSFPWENEIDYNKCYYKLRSISFFML